MKLKRTIICTVVLCMVFFLAGCPRKKNVENCPQDINSVWRTENGEVEFIIREDYHSAGTMQTEIGEIEVYFTISPLSQIDVYPIECVNIDEPTIILEVSERIEHWGADYYAKDEFSVNVLEST